jgi:peptidoglycan hydrolase-like protein with peptidoglycan-binding domain
MRVAAIIVAFAVAGFAVVAASTGPADAAKPRKPAASASKSAGKAGAKNTKSNVGKGKPEVVSPAPAAALAVYVAMPEAARVALQSDLAWVDAYADVAGGNPDDRTVAAIRTFQSRNGGKPDGILTLQERDLLAGAAQSRERNAGWRVLDDAATGARLGVPEKLTPQAETIRIGSRWSSAHGQIRIETFRLTEASLPALFEDEKKTAKREVHMSALEPQSFFISGVQGLKNFIERAQANGSEVRGITVLYDQATEGVMDAVALAIANAFSGFPDPNVALAGTKRTVEYATAIVVGAAGDLVAPADATDACQSITVPGLGHADRAAVDGTKGLALLRLYGARDLVPVALIPPGKADGDLTLIGIADPLSQAGDGAVTRVPAHLGPHGLEPSPGLGFAGAAGVDSQGRFAGMVDLQASVVAGSGAATRQATLAPAGTIRAFLQAHGVAVAAAAGSAVLDQSVLQIICVRR